MGTIAKMFDQIPAAWRGLVGVFAILSVGVSTGWAAHAWLDDAADLPMRIKVLETRASIHEAQIDSLRAANRELSRTLERVLCLVEAQSGIRPVSHCVR